MDSIFSLEKTSLEMVIYSYKKKKKKLPEVINLYPNKAKTPQDSQESTKHTPENHFLPTDTEINSETCFQMLNGSLVT